MIGRLPQDRLLWCSKAREEHIPHEKLSESVESEDSVMNDQPLAAQAAEFDALQLQMLCQRCARQCPGRASKLNRNRPELTRR